MNGEQISSLSENKDRKWPCKGHKVKFKGADGRFYPHFVNVVEFAKRNLKIGEIYTVRNCEVYSSWCALRLEGAGLSDAFFHLSMFEWPVKENYDNNN